MCDDDCKVTFTKQSVVVTKQDMHVWEGNRDPTTWLWLLPLNKEHTHNINAVYTIGNVKQKIEYLHACAGYPPLQAWLAAVDKGYYKTWPIINKQNTSKHLNEPIPTLKVHMNLNRMNTRSTKTVYKENDTSNADLAIYYIL